MTFVGETIYLMIWTIIFMTILLRVVCVVIYVLKLVFVAHVL